MKNWTQPVAIGDAEATVTVRNGKHVFLDTPGDAIKMTPHEARTLALALNMAAYVAERRVK